MVEWFNPQDNFDDQGAIKIVSQDQFETVEDRLELKSDEFRDSDFYPDVQDKESEDESEDAAYERSDYDKLIRDEDLDEDMGDGKGRFEEVYDEDEDEEMDG
ncbi:hypothetical protein MMC13_002491 [Lambiella insularis]|nr:hypothetical protein [Lambiella insularis]